MNKTVISSFLSEDKKMSYISEVEIKKKMGLVSKKLKSLLKEEASHFFRVTKIDIHAGDEEYFEETGMWGFFEIAGNVDYESIIENASGIKTKNEARLWAKREIESLSKNFLKKDKLGVEVGI